MKNIAIIGAGMTGLSLAYNLQEHNITIFDKSWRPGGRVSTRKHDNYLFDHGAHYLSTNHSVVQLNEVISRYNLGQIIEIDFATDYLKNKKTRKKIIIGQNGMNSIPKSIFDNIKVKSYLNSKIIKISKNSNDLFSLFSEKEEFKDFDYILICIPYLQSKELSKELIDFTQIFSEPSYDPIHTVMLSYKDNNNINVKAISQGASERNISAVINKKNIKKALNSLHETFFEKNIKEVNVFITGVGNVGSELINQLINQEEYLLNNLNIKINKNGTIDVDKNFQTNIEGIYAIGDVISGPMLAHKASSEGHVFAEQLLGNKPEVNY